MLFLIVLLIFIVVVVARVSPKESEEDAHIHGAGQVGLLAALALFGVEYRCPLHLAITTTPCTVTLAKRIYKT